MPHDETDNDDRRTVLTKKYKRDDLVPLSEHVCHSIAYLVGAGAKRVVDLAKKKPDEDYLRETKTLVECAMRIHRINVADENRQRDTDDTLPAARIITALSKEIFTDDPEYFEYLREKTLNTPEESGDVGAAR